MRLSESGGRVEDGGIPGPELPKDGVPESGSGVVGGRDIQPALSRGALAFFPGESVEESQRERGDGVGVVAGTGSRPGSRSYFSRTASSASLWASAVSSRPRRRRCHTIRYQWLPKPARRGIGSSAGTRLFSLQYRQ
ncbi:hypothetical protein [Halovenus salina]|uniref:Uncharacterized protein n=1 Tax=Halovenus salina TaxID=1510225 RepID=A0ABD5W2M5_9EURY